MILAERHCIKRTKKTKKLIDKIDNYCYQAKNLKNATNYIIKQCSRISNLLRNGEILERWEKQFIYKVNCAIKAYNDDRPDKYQLKYLDGTNSFIADAYFLSWYLKNSKEYKDTPYATCAQIIIQELCRDWKSFYKGMKAYKNKTRGMLGRPHTPKYLDKETGRSWLILPNQTFKIIDNNVKFPKFLNELKLQVKHDHIHQIRITTKNKKLHIDVLYENIPNPKDVGKSKILSVDMGVDNFTTIVSNFELEPIIITGKPLKSINQFYNKLTAELKSMAIKLNNKFSTKRLMKLTERRNNKVTDYIHKASRKIVDIAIENGIGTIIIGNNAGWKQGVNLGHRTNQNFVSIPFYQLIEKIKYKAELCGIEVIVVEESYTSGTSYLDDEPPVKEFYNKSRRKSRGVFQSNSGIKINADVNAAYQIMKKVDSINVPIKIKERVTTINVA